MKSVSDGSVTVTINKDAFSAFPYQTIPKSRVCINNLTHRSTNLLQLSFAPPLTPYLLAIFSNHTYCNGT